MERDTRRLARISVGLGIAIVTLLPVHAGLAQGLRPEMLATLGETFLGNLCVIDPIDIVQNLLLFLPFGYFIAVPSASAVDKRSRATALAWRAGAAGVALSTVLEFLQLWIPGRYCSLLDVLLNGAGACLGGLLASAWRPDAGDPIGEV